MDNKKFSVQKSKKYLVAFVFVMLLNIGLGAFLLHTALGQTSNTRTQKPLIAEIVTQTDSPILLTVINIDNTAESHQTINYAVQNASSKKIKAYVLLHTDSAGVGGASISFFRSFVSGQIIQNSIFEERANLKSDRKIFLSLDYIEFEDGSSWGKDSQQQSEYISGHNEGQKDAIEQIKQILISRDRKAVSELLNQEIAETTPSISNKGTAKWQRGFATGYNSVLARLKSTYEKQGFEAIPLKLQEIEKFMKKEEK